ncbi:putative bifunctional diguanylate cyclase/phosphodiesterase [Marinobacterium aestuariivivens]|uniref:Bifunctional diguanylate cyclase/phosphodiesterase n=1 Tax=Marinobacterium aestuariivivens TaxID=1698799 RepID=A0ABW2A4G5_9GAMM
MRARRAGAALLFIDLDRFKNINETLGLAGGDDLLQQVARRLADCLRPGDSLARLGSDEFCILLPDLGQVTASQNVARRIQQGFQAPFQLGDEEVHVTCTIGIALYPDDTGDAPTLLRQADTAAHHAKRHGRNAIQYFDDGINREAQQRLQLNEGLRRALGSDELFVEYQPRYDISGLKVLGAEALVRWRHPEQGLVSPMTFIPLAEESGLILELGGQVLRQACVAAQQWNRDSLTPVPVSVNLSPRQLRDPDLIGAVCDALQHSGLPPELLELEITETVVIEDINRVLGTLHELRDMGISISVDDFGTGYSSLIYLKKLPVDTVKIDRSFVNDVPGSTDDEYLIEAIISMAHSLRLRVVAEGVETEEQRAFLQRLGCDELQGYLLGRPGSAETMIGLTRDRSRDGASRKLPRLLGEH